MNGWTDDLRSAYRSLWRRPGLTLAALLTLAIGIGANTVIFTVIEGVLIHPLPYRNGDQLVYLKVGYQHGEHTMSVPPSLAMLDAWRQAPSLECLEAYEHLNVQLKQSTETREVNSLSVSPGMLPCLGVEPLLGRSFSNDEGRPGAEKVALLSYRLWRGHFASDSDIVGEVIDIGLEPHTIIGVLPPEARFIEARTEIDLWRPMDSQPADLSAASAFGLGRLRHGATVESARVETDALSTPFQKDDVELLPVMETPRDKVGNLANSLLLFQLAVGSILLIACVNVAQLLLAQGESRSREMAMRTVLGARRARLVRQLLTESCLLALLGGASGLLAALWGLESLLRLLPEKLSHLERLTLNPTVLAFTCVLTLVTGVVFGLLPAFQGFVKNLSATLREGAVQTGTSRQRHLLRHGLIAAQVTLALVLLAGAGWLIQSQIRLSNVDPGFDTDNLWVARLSLNGGRAHGDGAAGDSDSEDSDSEDSNSGDSELNAMVRTILEGLRAAGPAFEQVTLADRLPPGSSFVTGGEIEAFGRTLTPEESSVMSPKIAMAPGFFRDVGITMLEGDEPTAGSLNSVAINENLAKLLWKDESAVGKRFRFSSDAAWMQVAGVVENVRQWSLHSSDYYLIYNPFEQRPSASVELAVRSAVAPEILFPEMKARLDALAPGVKVLHIAGARQRLIGTIENERFNALVMVIFAVIAALLTAVGIYGVVAYAVSQATREIGIRMALGALGRQVLWLHVRRGLPAVVGGSVLGLGGALAGAHLLEKHLPGVEAGSFEVLAAVLLLVTSVSLLATWLPARRAAKVEPATSLRCN